MRRLTPPLAHPLLLLVLLAACDCDDSSGPCDQADAPTGCDAPCEASSTCAAGLYCDPDRGVCTADCDESSGCADGESCSAEGRCVPDQRTDGSLTDGSQRRDLGDSCPSVSVGARRVTPTVIVLVDQSSSMTADFGSSNRWDALRDSLLDPTDGLIASLEDQVRFGLTLYSARADGSDSGPPIGECPLLTQVEAMVGNYDAIRAVYEAADPIDETPTGDSIDAVLDDWLGMPDRPTDPTILILATDGEPDRCEELNPQNGQAEAIAAVERAFANDIRTYVISVGSGVSTDHLQDVANAGLGVAAGADADFWVAGDDAGLRDALREIVAGELSCTLELSSALEDVSEACMGTVVLNGEELPCDDPDGWRAVDADTIELQGAACDELLTSAGATLTATFPCGVQLI